MTPPKSVSTFQNVCPLTGPKNPKNRGFKTTISEISVLRWEMKQGGTVKRVFWTICPSSAYQKPEKTEKTRFFPKSGSGKTTFSGTRHFGVKSTFLVILVFLL